MSNFLLRSITGIIFTLSIVLSIIWEPILYVLLFSTLCYFCIKELLELLNRANKDIHLRSLLIPASGSLIFLVSSLHFIMPMIIPTAFLAIIPLTFLAIIISELYRRDRNFIAAISQEFFALLYVVAPFIMLSYLVSGNIRNSGSELLLGFFIVLWTYDSMAYVSGVLIGKHRLFPSLSPKKSWEGFIGGMLFSMGAAYILSLFFPLLTCLEWILMAVITGIFGTFGDLSESWIKRQMNIKDSGTMLPGHGGLLDRFDAVFFAAPALLAYFLIINAL